MYLEKGSEKVIRVISSYEDDKNIVWPEIYESESIEAATEQVEMLYDTYPNADLTFKIEIPRRKE
jgi:hypothetical protein